MGFERFLPDRCTAVVDPLNIRENNSSAQKGVSKALIYLEVSWSLALLSPATRSVHLPSLMKEAAPARNAREDVLRKKSRSAEHLLATGKLDDKASTCDATNSSFLRSSSTVER